MCSISHVDVALENRTHLALPMLPSSHLTNRPFVLVSLKTDSQMDRIGSICAIHEVQSCLICEQ